MAHILSGRCWRMQYVKQNFTDGTILTAHHLNHIEEGIAEAIPQVTVADVGKFLRVSASGEWQATALTDVSEVGA